MEDSLILNSKIAVIGCGIFGSAIALKLSERSSNVTVFEKEEMPLSGASSNNQNRLHLGYHYPRDFETAKQCIRGYEEFKNEFRDCVSEDFINTYFISSKDSLTTPNEYLYFCDSLGLDYSIIESKSFSPLVENVSLGVIAKEAVYDCNLLRGDINKRIKDARIDLRLNTEVKTIKKIGEKYIVNGEEFDNVVNCTYSNINMLNSQLMLEVPTYRYEFTAIPIIEWDEPSVGITVMDGPFMTVLPYGKSSQFLLYHVEHSVVNSYTGQEMPINFTNPDINFDDLFYKIRDASEKFIPSLRNSTLKGFLKGPRVVIENDRDSRESLITKHDHGYWSVFSGKVDHCMWVAREINREIFD